MEPWAHAPIFRKERVEATYWWLKMFVDLLLVGMLSLAILSVHHAAPLAAASNANLTQCNPNFNPHCSAPATLGHFKSYILFVGFLLYTLELVRATELAWSIRQSVLDHKLEEDKKEPLPVYYIAANGRLPPSAMDAMWGSRRWPTFVNRVVSALVNAVWFCLLPVGWAVTKCLRSGPRFRVSMLDWFQYVSFAPGILLAAMLFPTLVVLVGDQATSALEGVVALLALRMLPMLSVETVDLALRRSRSGAEALQPFTLPPVTLATRLLSSLRYVERLVVDREFEHEMGVDLEGVLVALREVLPRVNNPVRIEFRGYKQYEFENEDFRLQRRLIQVLRQLRQPSLSSVLLDGMDAGFIEKVLAAPRVPADVRIDHTQEEASPRFGGLRKLDSASANSRQSSYHSEDDEGGQPGRGQVEATIEEFDLEAGKRKPST